MKHLKHTVWLVGMALVMALVSACNEPAPSAPLPSDEPSAQSSTETPPPIPEPSEIPTWVPEPPPGSIPVPTATPTTENLVGLCQDRSAHGTHIVQKWVPAGGWGWTNYQVRPLAYGGDMCNNSDISVSISGVDEGVVAQRSGYVTADVYVRYINMDTNKIGNWINVPLTKTWPTRQYFRQISMTQRTQVLQVVVGTRIWIKQDGSNWVPMTQMAWTNCAMRYSGPKWPGGCYSW